MKKFHLRPFALVGLLLMGTACESETSGEQSDNQEAEGSSEEAAAEEGEGPAEQDDWPDPLVYGILPSEDEQELSDEYEPLAGYLSDELGVDVEFHVGTDYNAMIEAMANDHIHVAHYGPFSYVLANERSGGEAFAMGIEAEGEETYQSNIVTLEDSDIESVEDLKGSDIAFVDPASTSGHLFPMSHLVNTLDSSMEEVESMFENVTFAGGHDTAMLALLNGDVDAAGVGDFIVDDVEHENIDQVQIVDETDEIPHGPETIQSDLPESLKDAVVEAFLTMDEDPEVQNFLEDRDNQAGFIEVEDSTYDIIRETSDALEMSPEALME
ncbi:phosphonate transport system substrate-binding protein [Geomicrobium halophilum]|uniref:Phosphonate transport system substrate-binding protein n=1 Tax=Geomicrobium halophilum TaxID=549000 RepID=A0A841PZ96_9BACL|nr:phosphonate transport system substrate-binding protein [Geomicrobium halophilum]